jgi:outer membrane protein assembly factor BamA
LLKVVHWFVPPTMLNDICNTTYSNLHGQYFSGNGKPDPCKFEQFISDHCVLFKMIRVFRNILFLFCLCCQNLFAQSPISLQLIPLDKDTSFLQDNFEYSDSFSDSISLYNELKRVLIQLNNQSFLEASFDRIEKEDSIIYAYLYIGAPYEWAKLTNGNVDKAFISQVGFLEKLYQNKPFYYSELSSFQEKLLEYAENNGYPFAAVWLDSIHVFEQKIEAKIFMKKGNLVTLDSLNIKGDAKISKTYLSNYLGLKEGGLYNKKKVLQIRDRIRELPFLKDKSPPTVTFIENKATINLYLEKKKASRFDFLIGFLPNNNNEDNRLLLTGDFEAEMENQFGLGEKIHASFERLRPATQELEVAFAYPYILDLPFGVDLKFNQYKRDSTYSDVIFDFGVQYLLEGGNYLKVFWNRFSSNLLSVDTNRIKQGQFPRNLDVVNSTFGLEYVWQKLDYRFNPREGWRFLVRAGAGVKEIRENQAILNVAENFYDTLNVQTFQYKIDGKVERFFPLGNRSTVLGRGESGLIISENPIYQNEQYRIGGNKLLRGFDEEAIFATFFAVFTLEYRLLIGQNSYFNVFGDYAYLEDRAVGKRRFDQPFGFGLGMNFETKAGVFGINLAVGSQQGDSPDFQNPKIHFGYVSYF